VREMSEAELMESGDVQLLEALDVLQTAAQR
jgi:hypothetical protein